LLVSIPSGEVEEQGFRFLERLRPPMSDDRSIRTIIGGDGHGHSGAGSEIAPRVARIQSGREQELSVPPQVPERPNPWVSLAVDGGEMAQPGSGQERVDLLAGHRHDELLYGNSEKAT
jgi:hypothetical protein